MFRLKLFYMFLITLFSLTFLVGCSPTSSPPQEISQNCYEADPGEIGQGEGCEGKLIVNREMLLQATSNSESEPYIEGPEGEEFTIANSYFDDKNVFTGNVEDMSELFKFNSDFDGDIGYWDVSNVENMSRMFTDASEFNSYIGDWDVSNVVDMSDMFWTATSFNQDIGEWDVSNVENMDWLFTGASVFNQDISSWDVSNVEKMEEMFRDAYLFEQDLTQWCVEKIEDRPNSFAINSQIEADESMHPNWGESC